MTDRINTIETALATQLAAASAITAKFTKIEIGFRERLNDYMSGELPAIVFESYEVEDFQADADYANAIFELIRIIAVVVVENGNIKTARQYVKERVSLVRDFLRGTAWSYRENTIVGKSTIEEIQIKNSYRAVGTIEFTVEVATE